MSKEKKETKKTVELKDEQLEKVTGGVEPEQGCGPQTPDVVSTMPGGRNPQLVGPGKHNQ